MGMTINYVGLWMLVSIKIIFFLMFYRYLSENQDVYLAQNGLEEFYDVTDEEEQEDYIVKILAVIFGYAIKPEYTWKRLVAKIENHRTRRAISKICLTL